MVTKWSAFPVLPASSKSHGAPVSSFDRCILSVQATFGSANPTALSFLSMTGSVRYTAPAVRYSFVRSAVLAILVFVISAASGAGVFAFAVAQGRTGSGLQWTAVLALAAWVIASLCALRYWWCAPSGELVWDGQGWAIHFVADEEPLALRRAPQVLVDMQAWLWVTVVHGDLRRSWIWLERSRQTERWGDLRRAVYSPAMQVATPASLFNPAQGREP